MVQLKAFQNHACRTAKVRLELSLGRWSLSTVVILQRSPQHALAAYSLPRASQAQSETLPVWAYGQAYPSRVLSHCLGDQLAAD